MAKPYVLYGWELSLYSGKLRAYLRHKELPFRERHVSFWDMRKLKRKVGAKVMPVLLTADGEWLQDTADIIDVLELRHPRAPIVPETPRQRIAAYLLEAWGDEFWVSSAMHYRWNFPENYQGVFRPEGGDNLMPFAPRFVKDRLIATAAGAMRSFLPGLGVVPGQTATIEAWTEAMLDALEEHFTHYPYLLGSRPCLGDFGLIGPLYAHLGRDPYPLRELIAPRPHLKGWIERMQHPESPGTGTFLAEDHVPETLAPLFGSVFGEFWPLLRRTQAEVNKALPLLERGRGFRRDLGSVEIALAGKPFRLGARPFALWKAQRVLDAYRALTSAGRDSVDPWLSAVGGADAMTLDIQPRLARKGLHIIPAPAPPNS